MFDKFQTSFEEYAKKQFAKTVDPSNFFVKQLSYSFFSGGKRARPVLMLSVADHLGGLPDKVLAPAFGLELIHTYSLVHDDLPCMDNDEYRRGKLTHHKKFGEAEAVLAGDALLTWAFEHIAEKSTPEVGINLVKLFSQCSGINGMIGGQVLDSLTDERDEKIFQKIHYLKTAKLFEASCLAASYAMGSDGFTHESLGILGKELGLLFQLQDDLFDKDKKNERESENILSIVSEEKLKNLIEGKISLVKNLKKDLNILDQSALSKYINYLGKRDF